MSTLMNRVAGMSRILRTVADRLQWLAPTLARFSVGWLFFWTGWGKLNNLPDIVSYFRDLGIPAPEFQAPLASGAEFICGGLLLIGLFSRCAAVPLMVTMVVAIATAKAEELTAIPDLFGFTEYLYILLLLYVGVSGPGPLSIDRLLARRPGAATDPVPHPVATR